jgi:hypothetical protein
MSKAAQLSIGNRLPAFYRAAEFARVGGLMAYGPNLPDTFYKAGVMVGKNLAGDEASGSSDRTANQIRTGN